MATLASLIGSGVKSIQRGTISISAGGTATVTITAVNTNFSELRHLGTTAAGGGAEVRIAFTNSTTITAVSNSANGAVVSWEVTEFNG